MPEDGRAAWPPATPWWATVPDQIGRRMLALFGARCSSGWDDVRRALGDPDSILCLGNGPSSESDAVHDVRFDRLLRVNWIWSDRARHVSPDVVFTADLDPPPVEPTPTICFPTRQDANRILASYVLRRIPLPSAYWIFPELPSESVTKTWSHRPTNGAIMVAAAVQLRPKRLAIAGIDLYLHPDGKYPGSRDEPNSYDSIHDRDVDLDFIIAALRGFTGEVEILSPQLRSTLEARTGLAWGPN